MRHADQIVMHGPRITLRKLVDDDLDFLAAMLGNSEVMKYWPKPLDRAEVEQWLRKQQRRYVNDGCGYWLVVDNETQQPVGQAGIIMTDIDGERLPALAYMIHRPFWRKGYGIEAAWSCMAWLDHARKAPKIYTLIRPENEPSMALARKLNFTALRTVDRDGLEHVLLARDVRV